MLVEGPFGRLSRAGPDAAWVALIGAGVGVTPLRALAEGLDYAPGEAVLLQRFTERAALRARAGRAVAGARPAGPVPARPPALPGLLARGRDRHRRRPRRPAHWVPDVAERDVYVCGPEPWVDSVRRTTEAAGVPADRFHVETFRW